MAKKFSDLRASMNQAARERLDVHAKVMLAECRSTKYAKRGVCRKKYRLMFFMNETLPQNINE